MIDLAEIAPDWRLLRGVRKGSMTAKGWSVEQASGRGSLIEEKRGET